MGIVCQQLSDKFDDLEKLATSWIYDILFRTSAETLHTIAADPKHLGAEIGFLSVLHTWGQHLLHHPHVHCVIGDCRTSTRVRATICLKCSTIASARDPRSSPANYLLNTGTPGCKTRLSPTQSSTASSIRLTSLH